MKAFALTSDESLRFSLSRDSVVRKIDGSDMTVVVYCDHKPKIQTHFVRDVRSKLVKVCHLLSFL